MDVLVLRAQAFWSLRSLSATSTVVMAAVITADHAGSHDGHNLSRAPKYEETFQLPDANSLRFGNAQAQTKFAS